MTQIHSVCNRIRNARASLDNAERSFSRNQDVRGELDLMLAEAELENLRRQNKGLFSWTRHTLALCLAVMVLAAGGLGWWWASSYGGNTTNAAEPRALPVITDAGEAPAVKKTAVPLPERNRPPAEAGSKAGLYAEQKPVTPAPGPVYREKKEGNPGIRLSSGQMRQLVRSGKQELGNMK